MKAYLLDLDGTVAASEPLKARAISLACATYGVDADHRVYAEIMGQDWTSVTRHFFDAYRFDPPTDDFNARFRRFYVELIEAEIAETLGATQFVREARKKGMNVAVVSSAAGWMVQIVLAKLGLGTAFDLIVTQDDVTSHKPDPEAYLLALARLGIGAQDALVFEDSYAGLQAASAAGCRCIAVRHSFNETHDFSSAIRVIRSFSELLD
ncbi:HAD family phosphatase [Bradyrhizobium sp. STM 3809]|uniref:HAD family hydrolase n=1 Tax=Bradyrhizobium sp. STM 3809 TaxID=551936 RepID=UPI00024092D0|nr:HAD family phosphatase [Bradyrhizobium sp. STM 3809]CCE00943.1 putative phosphatase [Bradyrhizobium sp. STM 3809]